jgi:hypothetical protein
MIIPGSERSPGYNRSSRHVLYSCVGERINRKTVCRNACFFLKPMEEEKRREPSQEIAYFMIA